MGNPVDLGIFRWLRETLPAAFLDDFLVILANPFAWVPYFVFIAVLLYLYKPRRFWLYLLFGGGTYVISFQVAWLLAALDPQPPPFAVESIKGGLFLPAFSVMYEPSMPDWVSASMSGVYAFSYRSLPSYHRWLNPFLVAGVVLVAFSRVFTGFCFPTHALAGIVIGLVVGLLMGRFMDNLEIVLNEPRK